MFCLFNLETFGKSALVNQRTVPMVALDSWLRMDRANAARQQSIVGKTHHDHAPTTGRRHVRRANKNDHWIRSVISQRTTKTKSTSRSTMKTAFACLLALLLEVSNAFIIPTVTSTLTGNANASMIAATRRGGAEATRSSTPAGDSRHYTTRTLLAAGGPEVEESDGGLDLDLDEMFTMFDAADKEESFDDAIKKVKTDEKKKES
jgi:hypothetical protein